jgi:hypothetical protein
VEAWNYSSRRLYDTPPQGIYDKSYIPSHNEWARGRHGLIQRVVTPHERVYEASREPVYSRTSSGRNLILTSCVLLSWVARRESTRAACRLTRTTRYRTRPKPPCERMPDRTDALKALSISFSVWRTRVSEPLEPPRGGAGDFQRGLQYSTVNRLVHPHSHRVVSIDTDAESNP